MNSGGKILFTIHWFTCSILRSTFYLFLFKLIDFSKKNLFSYFRYFEELFSKCEADRDSGNTNFHV